MIINNDILSQMADVKAALDGRGSVQALSLTGETCQAQGCGGCPIAKCPERGHNEHKLPLAEGYAIADAHDVTISGLTFGLGGDPGIWVSLAGLTQNVTFVDCAFIRTAFKGTMRGVIFQGCDFRFDISIEDGGRFIDCLCEGCYGCIDNFSEDEAVAGLKLVNCGPDEDTFIAHA